MSTAQPVTKKPGLPILQGILPIVGSRVPIDIIAGITLAALAIPEVMGYTKIAGMPVVTGLYTILIPTAPLAAALQERRPEGACGSFAWKLRAQGSAPVQTTAKRWR